MTRREFPIKTWGIIVAAWAMLGLLYAGPIYFEVEAEGIGLLSNGVVDERTTS